MPPRRSARKTLLLAGAATVALWFVPFASLLLYPLRLFVTFIHEGSHALVALLTGGRVFQIVVQPDGSGETLTAGGWPILILMAGYLGATAYGAGLLTLGRRPGASRAALAITAAVVAVLTLAFVHPWVDRFAFGWGLALALGLGVAARRLPAGGTELLAMFLGVQCTLNALFDLKTLLGLSLGPGGPPTDAVLLSQILPLPPLVWAALWGLLSLAILIAALRPYGRPDPIARSRS